MLVNVQSNFDKNMTEDKKGQTKIKSKCFLRLTTTTPSTAFHLCSTSQFFWPRSKLLGTGEVGLLQARCPSCCPTNVSKHRKVNNNDKEY